MSFALLCENLRCPYSDTNVPPPRTLQFIHRFNNHKMEDIAMKHKTCIHVTGANEATRHKFISSVLHGVASCYDGEVKVCLKFELILHGYTTRIHVQYANFCLFSQMNGSVRIVILVIAVEIYHKCRSKEII